jgi:D-alanyl-D-alanine carboxypeptidase
MYFQLPEFISLLITIPPLWGHSGSTGSFLYYSEDENLYMAGTIDQVDAKSTPFILMTKVIMAIHSKTQDQHTNIEN